MITDIQFIWRGGSWRHPSEWVFEIQHPCKSRCTIWWLGFFVIEFRRNGCKGDDQ